MIGAASPSPTGPGSRADVLAASAGPSILVTPPGAETPAPSSSFTAMLAAIAPQPVASTPTGAAPTTAAPGDRADGESDTDTTTDDAAGQDNALLLALAGAVPQTSLPRVSIPSAKGQSGSATGTGRIAARPLLRPDAALLANGTTPEDASASNAIGARPDASPAAVSGTDVDLAKLFPGLAEKLSGAAAPAPPRGKPARAPAVSGAVAGAGATAAPSSTIVSTTAPTDAIAHMTEAASRAEAPVPDATAPAAATGIAPQAQPADLSAASATGTPAAAPADTTVQTQLDVAHEGAWLDRLARDIAGAAGQDRTLAFQLNPHHLGELKVEVANGDAGASIRMTAASAAAHALLVDQQPRLLAEARAQGMRIADARIDLGGQGAQGGFGAGGQAPQQQQQQSQRAAWVPLPITGISRSIEDAATRTGSSERYA